MTVRDWRDTMKELEGVTVCRLSLDKSLFEHDFTTEWLAEFCRRNDLRMFIDFDSKDERWSISITAEGGTIGGLFHSVRDCGSLREAIKEIATEAERRGLCF